ncbi:MAG TPA: DUF2637 domain-containing protein [Streptosporangiaceae bacterium]|jgi:uncharacterized membrane protein SirB2|nr:DUF2637 domain-containing protein [Streptosporangiaceae bacterium]
MNDNPRANGSRGRDPYAALRLIALIAAIVGVIVLAAAAFVLSYGGIHKIALSAGVSPNVARIFPVIFDAMLVVSCAAVVSLRSAGWWPRTYSWLSTLALLVVVAAADAAHATGTHIPRKPAAATVAVLPWALLLLAFSLLLSMLRQFRRTRAAAADARVTDSAAAEPVPVGTASAGQPGLDILNPRVPAQQPAVAGTLPVEAPDSVSPAGPTSQNIQTRRTDADQQPQRNPSQPAPPPGPQQAGPPEPPAGRGEAAAGVTPAESGLNGAAPARYADREPPGQERPDQEPVGEEQAVQEQVALEEAGEEEAPGDRQAEPAPEARAQSAEARSADTEPAGAQPPEAQPANPAPADAPAAEARSADAEPADAHSPEAQPSEAQPPSAHSPEAQSPEAQPADVEPPDAESHTDQPGSDEQAHSQAPPAGKPGAEPAGPQSEGAGGGTIHVPHQAMPAPVPAPSPHFDRLRSTPTPPEDEPDSDS